MSEWERFQRVSRQVAARFSSPAASSTRPGTGAIDAVHRRRQAVHDGHHAAFVGSDRCLQHLRETATQMEANVHFVTLTRGFVRAQIEGWEPIAIVLEERFMRASPWVADIAYDGSVAGDLSALFNELLPGGCPLYVVADRGSASNIEWPGPIFLPNVRTQRWLASYEFPPVLLSVVHRAAQTMTAENRP